MSDADLLRILRAQLDDDAEFVLENARRHREMMRRASRSTDDEMATMAVAYLLHNLYTALEGYFFRIAKHFENSLDDSSWHKELLDRMKIEVAGIRPAVITADMMEPLDELRRFRHLFRNLYKSRLRPGRIKEISDSIDPLIRKFTDCHRQFIEWLDQIISEE